MKEDSVGLIIGGQMNIYYTNYDNEENFFQDADDRERVKDMLEVFA